jgi:hypothetical protein
MERHGRRKRKRRAFAFGQMLGVKGLVWSALPDGSGTFVQVLQRQTHMFLMILPRS